MNQHLRDLCEMCNLCWFSKPEETRIGLGMESRLGEDPLVLVIDDCPTVLDMLARYERVKNLVFPALFTYTSTLRCNTPKELTEEQEVEALSTCSVWTNQLLENRALIITTVKGTWQMKLSKEHKEGDLFKSKQYGVIAVIPPIDHISTADSLRIGRALKEIGMR